PLRVNTSGSPVNRYRAKKVWTRGLSWHPGDPLPPGDGFDADRADTRRPLRPPPLTASHHRGMLTPLLAGAMAGREQVAPEAAARDGEWGPRPWRACKAATAWPSPCRGWARDATRAGVCSHAGGKNYNNQWCYFPFAVQKVQKLNFQGGLS